MSDKSTKQGFFSRILSWGQRQWEYCSEGVWSDTRRVWYVNIIKTINLSVRSFLDRNLQSQAAAMTFKTLLATVPALALMFAIGKGFDIQNGLQAVLYKYFPGQTQALEKAMTFVDSYLESSSEGVFVGIGIVFLLYTLISLLGSVEDSFNLIWGIKQGRSLGRKITDYTAILLILPILLICSSGITVFMSSMLQLALPGKTFTPLIQYIVDFAGVVLGWLFFAGTYMLVPNTNVKFKNALMAGILAGTSYFILQWLFVSGQIYVTRYNAIYGSFAFLPLLLLWMQLVWLITLAGGVLCYASQSINEFSYTNKTSRISLDYRRKIIIGVMLVTIKRREKQLPPVNEQIIASQYGLPISLVTDAVNELVDVRLLERVIPYDNGSGESTGIAPALDTDVITLGMVIERLREKGTKDFIPDFNCHFENVIKTIDTNYRVSLDDADKILLRDIPFNIL